MPDPIHDIISDILVREGGSKVTNDPSDSGGRTQYGIAERSNPGAWFDGKVTEEEARAIYTTKYVVAPGFDKVPDPQLQAQLVDFGVNSGPFIATQKLQEILKVSADGKLGPMTLAALCNVAFQHPSGWVNNQLVAARVKMFGKIVVKNPSQLKFLNGWLNRALEFIV
jgi:lysozyme family protein